MLWYHPFSLPLKHKEVALEVLLEHNVITMVFSFILIDELWLMCCLNREIKFTETIGWASTFHIRYISSFLISEIPFVCFALFSLSCRFRSFRFVILFPNLLLHHFMGRVTLTVHE